MSELSKPDVTAKKHNFMYKLEPLSEHENLEIKSKYRGYLSGAVRVGPQGYFMQTIYQDYAQDIYDFNFRASDVVVASYPKTGTTWMQELVWLLVNNFDYEEAKVTLDERFTFVEADCVIDCQVYKFPEVVKKLAGRAAPGKWYHLDATHKLRDPRTIKTHMPFSLLPPDLLDVCKVVYVTRDPRDVALSYYHHHRIIVSHGFTGTFEDFLEDFLHDRVMYSPFWSHVREAWERKSHQNLFFVTYEELKKDLPAVIGRLATFLGTTMTDEQHCKLVKHLHIDTMKLNPAINGDDDPLIFSDAKEGGFIRKGVSGGWRSQFSQQRKEDFQRWTADSLGGEEVGVALGWL